ncbi:Uncharacterized protein FKW44_018228, partial [Caligus rogercresseyi]
NFIMDHKNSSNIVDHEYVTNLKIHFSNLDFGILSEGTNHSSKTSYLPKDLLDTEFVWIRVDRIKGPLKAPYIGPAKVISRNSHTFKIEYLSGKQDVISIERLNPAKYYPMSTLQKSSSSRTDNRKKL